MVTLAVVKDKKKDIRTMEAGAALQPDEIRNAHRELTAQIAKDKGLETCDASNEAWSIIFKDTLGDT